MKQLLRRYEQFESDDHGACRVELWAIGWELYSIRVNDEELEKVVGISRALDKLQDHCNLDDTSWHETFNVNF